jgi:hypothetical protein
MTMQTTTEGPFEVLERPTEIVTSATLVALNKSDLEAQLDAAHKYPRSIKNFVDGAKTLATLNKAVATSCIYALPRGGKPISGPSVRLAEICLSAYGNMHAAARPLDPDATTISAQAVAWDLEKNVKVTIEARRGILDKYGKRFKDDMVNVTAAAAVSIALRNAVFRVIPRALVDDIYAHVREVSVGNAKTLVANRENTVGWLQKIGVPLERIFAAVGAKGIDDVDLDRLEQLMGLGTAVRTKSATIDEAFPPLDTTRDRAKSLQADLTGPKPEAPKSDPKVAEKPPAKKKREVIDEATGEVRPEDEPTDADLSGGGT